jgi:hypothetical protein
MRNRALIAVVVAALVAAAGCGAVGDGQQATTQSPGDAASVHERVADATADVETYAVDFRLNLSANGELLQLTQVGVYDRADERARLNMSVYGTPSTAYVDGETMYVEAAGQWQRQDLAGSGLWGENSTLGRQRALLAAGEASAVGSETVDGVETTVYEVDADPGAFESLLSQSPGSAQASLTVQNASYRLFVADDTGLPRRAELSTTVTARGQSTLANVTIAFSEYGEPVSVTVPEAAPTGDDGSA